MNYVQKLWQHINRLRAAMHVATNTLISVRVDKKKCWVDIKICMSSQKQWFSNRYHVYYAKISRNEVRRLRKYSYAYCVRAAVTREKRNCRASPPLFKRYATHGCQLNRLLRNPVNHELEVIIVCAFVFILLLRL